MEEKKMKIKKAIICVACLIGICSISAIASEYSESESFEKMLPRSHRKADPEQQQMKHWFKEKR